MNFRRFLTVLGVTAGVSILSSCSTPTNPFEYIACPTFLVLADAQEITQFKPGSGRDVTDIQYTGRIKHVDYTCKEITAKGKDYIDANLVISAEFEMGAAADVRNPTFQLFTALSQSNEKIIAKSYFDLRARFKDKSRRAEVKQYIKKIRVERDTTVPVEDHQLYMGFQLTPAQLGYNRTKHLR